MFWATNQMVQKMLYSKCEIGKDGQDGSLTSRWNFAQRPHSNSPVTSRVQGSNAYSSTKTEVITFCTIINTDFTTLGHHNHPFLCLDKIMLTMPLWLEVTNATLLSGIWGRTILCISQADYSTQLSERKKGLACQWDAKLRSGSLPGPEADSSSENWDSNWEVESCYCIFVRPQAHKSIVPSKWDKSSCHDRCSCRIAGSDRKLRLDNGQTI